MVRNPKTLTPTNVDPVRDSFTHLLTISFAKTNSQHYPLAVNFMQGASKYDMQSISSIPVHFAAFSKTKEDASRALAVLGYIQGWTTTQVFSNGRLLGHASRVIDVLRCYLESLACTDYRAHCFKVIQDPFSETTTSGMTAFIQISLEEPVNPTKVIVDQYIFPCSRLNQWYSLQRGHPSSPVDQIQAASVRYECDWCPNLNPQDFRKLE
jgi:hypothetical protein